MTSGFSGDFLYAGGATRPTIGGTQGGVLPYGFRQQQQQLLHQQQQQQQQQGVFMGDQIGGVQQQQRRADLFMGKRSFSDFQQQQQQQQQHIIIQQQEQPFGMLQRQQQQAQTPLSLLQQQYLMRSVKQRTNNNFVASPISPLLSSSPSIDLSSCANNSTFNTRFGLPVYRSQQQQQQQFSLLGNNNSLIQSTNNNNSSSSSSSSLLNPGFSSSGYSNTGLNLAQPKTEFGFGSNPVQPKQDPDHGIMDSLHELEKELLNDEPEADAVSVITNSEWSETFQNLMGSDPNPSPSPAQSTTPNNTNNNNNNPVLASTSGSNNTTTNNNNNNNNNNNIISQSPTSSSASSCCSTSASPVATAPPPPPTPPPVVVSAKQLISEAAAAISDGKIEASVEVLGRLAQFANANGNSEQRLAFYMCDALRTRVNSRATADGPHVMDLFGSEHMSAMYSLYDISPNFRFGLFAANLVMLEAIASALNEGLKIHIIDFDVGHGGQYMNLLRAIAERRSQSGSSGSNDVKITVVETDTVCYGSAATENVKDGLVKLAEMVGISLRFESLTRKITELTRESLGCVEGEAIIVNFAFKLYRVPDESVSMENLRDELLRRVKGLNPRAVTLVEQDLNANTAPFVTRVNGACEYYGALFESIEAVARDSADRVRVEVALGRKMVNSVACEGRERVERAEVFGKWRARMGMAGFEMKPLGQSVAESMRGKLNSARGGNPGFTVKEESGGVGFGWMGRTLTIASAWR